MTQFPTSSAAFAFDSTCFTSLQPGMTAVTAGCFKHQARAHWAMGTPAGTSSLAIRSTSRSFRSISSGFCSWRVVPGGEFAAGLYFAVGETLGRGTRAEEARVWVFAYGES